MSCAEVTVSPALRRITSSAPGAVTFFAEARLDFSISAQKLNCSVSRSISAT
ncbi:MAG: hypothetical protein ACYTEZ_16370 [Planctomycetota bacterium]